ncbi:hypothetical protein PYW08_015657 [Mythimna loreyi]|uniref:Uncharacterized protein n=1 Tax=Mythimna loreyi TaxID=667449 RepID=A0ACC2QY89_9NEOP|nr:hypothetical protein PYW08_015657 [Mythimna loreyi]
MSGGVGPGRRGSYHGGTSTPSGARRPSRGGSGGSDNVLPLITGVLGSSILAFSLYVFSQKNGVFGGDVNQPSLGYTEHESSESEQAWSGAESSCPDAQPCPYHGEDTLKINAEKRRWPTEEEEATTRGRVPKDPSRSKLQRELKLHLRKVKELTEELEKDEKAKNWPR